MYIIFVLNRCHIHYISYIYHTYIDVYFSFYFSFHFDPWVFVRFFVSFVVACHRCCCLCFCLFVPFFFGAATTTAAAAAVFLFLSLFIGLCCCCCRSVQHSEHTETFIFSNRFAWLDKNYYFFVSVAFECLACNVVHGVSSHPLHHLSVNLLSSR